MAPVPKDRKYSKDHVWVKLDGKGIAVLGITEFAQKQMGDIVFAELPKQGEQLQMGGKLCSLESVKAVTEAKSPVSGVVEESNAAVEGNPTLVNESPFEKGWVVKAKLSNEGELQELMEASEYEEYLKGLG